MYLRFAGGRGGRGKIISLDDSSSLSDESIAFFALNFLASLLLASLSVSISDVSRACLAFSSALHKDAENISNIISKIL